MSQVSYSPEKAIRCCSDYRSGESVNTIIQKYNVPRSTVYYWLKQYKDISDVNDITLKKTLENIRRKYEKSQQMCEVLKTVNCTQSAPLKVKLSELERLYGQYSTHVLCEALDVSRGTFYNHMLRNKKQNNSYKQRRAELSAAVRKVYEESNGLFGSDKILSVLQTEGYHTSKKMVRELMKEMGLQSLRCHSKRDFATWKKLHETKNILQQDFTVDAPNTAWVSDCTQFMLLERKFYLCAVLDLFSRKIVAYRISKKASTQLVTATLKDAIESRQPTGNLIFHSDRGCQYTSYAFRELLIANNITQSFSQAGNPYDNGAMESFFSSLKQEEIYRTSYRSVADCKRHIANYMDFYNEKRPHRANNYRTPDAIEALYNKKTNPHV